MEHAEESDFRAEVFGIAGDGQQCLGAGAEQQAIDLPFVPQGQRR
jgi:hypothetical protein